MPSYIENFTVVSDTNPNSMLKPILFADYTTETKYTINITYEDATTKSVELVQGNTDRPYKVVYKKEGQLLTVTGVPKVYEINESSRYCDFVNRTMDSKDLLIEMDCSDMYNCNKARFYLKDIRDIVDLATEGLIEEPEEDNTTEEDNTAEVVFSEFHSLYPMYVQGKSCYDVVKCKVDENYKVTLISQITKLGKELLYSEYSDFTVISAEYPVMVDYMVMPEPNKIPLVFTEDSMDKDIKVIIKYFIKEINHSVFEEFTIRACTGSIEDEEEIPISSVLAMNKAASTQTTQYRGDNIEKALDIDYTPGYKEYRDYR